MKTLVAYFSAENGRTKTIAEKLASAIGADTFEITPSAPYTKAELNWKNPLSRVNKEKIGGKTVPYEGRVENFEQYDMVFVGFPIWYAGQPAVVDTFLKDYDFSGKKIAVFATSIAAGIGRAPAKVQKLVKGDVIGGIRFAAGENQENIKAWAESLI